MKPRKYFDFLLAMTEKEIKARYKNAVLGFLWIFLNPIFQMIIIGFIFQNFVKVPIDNYFLFLFPGLLAWIFFSYSLTKTTPSIVFERDLIQKANFPRESIPLSIVLSNFFHFLISIMLFIFYLIIFNSFSINNYLPTIFYFLTSLFWIFFLTCAFSLLTSALNVKYRDVNFFVQALVTLWFYATPIMYSLQILPQRYFHLFSFNPITYPFELLRSTLLKTPLPPNEILGMNLLISLIIAVLGIMIFRKESKSFSDWLLNWIKFPKNTFSITKSLPCWKISFPSMAKKKFGR
jgi:lipopolysaccharide transport system permease protein